MPSVQDGLDLDQTALVEHTDHSLHCLPYNVNFQNAWTLQSVSVFGSMVVIKRLAVCHVAVVSNIEEEGCN